MYRQWAYRENGLFLLLVSIRRILCRMNWMNLMQVFSIQSVTISCQHSNVVQSASTQHWLHICIHCILYIVWSTMETEYIECWTKSEYLQWSQCCYSYTFLVVFCSCWLRTADCRHPPMVITIRRIKFKCAHHQRHIAWSLKPQEGLATFSSSYFILLLLQNAF